jgi:hypothetical protein
MAKLKFSIGGPHNRLGFFGLIVSEKTSVIKKKEDGRTPRGNPDPAVMSSAYAKLLEPEEKLRQTPSPTPANRFEVSASIGAAT